MEECSRWDEIAASVRTIVQMADAGGVPTEIRFLNKAVPKSVGLPTPDGGKSYDDAMDLIEKTTPQGQTPLCKQVLEVVDQIKKSQSKLEASKTVAMVIIFTDGESTDGNVVDVLKPLERLPVEIVVRLSTDAKDLSEYWHNISAQLDLDVYVLDDLGTEAKEVAAHNPWLTYAEPLHRAREFGLDLPSAKYLKERQLTKQEIKNMAEALLSLGYLPDPDLDWRQFVEAIKAAVARAPLNSSAKSPSSSAAAASDEINVFCPIKLERRPWINVPELERYKPDKVQQVIDQNQVMK
jgi:hypothetical protein